MATFLIIFRQLGENVTTPRDPYGIVTETDPDGTVYFHLPYEEEIMSANLHRKVVCCRSFDDNSPAEKYLWSVSEVELPDGLSPEEWLENLTEWKFTWGMGCDRSWPITWQRGIRNLQTCAARLAVCKLLKTKKFRSSFRQSLRDQLVSHFETPIEDRKYPDPLSRKQWGCLITDYIAKEAERISTSLYYSGRHSGAME